MKILKNSRRLVAACYLAAVLLWIALAVFGGVRGLWARSRGQYPTITLTMADLERSSLETYADLGKTPPYEHPSLYLSTNNDPFVVWNGGGYIETVVLRAEHYIAPDSVTLYYLVPGQTEYSEKNKLFAAVTRKGEYRFDLGGRMVSGLRIDTDSRGGVPTRFDGVDINPAHGIGYYLVPDAAGLVLLALLPLAAAALLKLAGELYFLGGRKE